MKVIIQRIYSCRHPYVCLRFKREIELPYPPAPGMTIRFPKLPGDYDPDDFEITDLIYDVESGTYHANQWHGINLNDFELIPGYIQNHSERGWTIVPGATLPSEEPKQ